MGTHASVGSIDALKDLRTALALYAEEVLAALGGVEMEVKRATIWVQSERPNYWQQQVKLRRERLSEAQADLFRKKIAQRPGSAPAMSEQKEALRHAQASLQDAEARVVMVRKWQPLLQQAVLEYHGGTRRLKDLAASDVLRAVALLERLVDALEAYLRLAPPSGSAPSETSPFDTIADSMLTAEAEAQAETKAEAPPAEAETHGDDPEASDSDFSRG